MIPEIQNKLQRTNPYILLADTLPQYLFSCQRQHPSDEEAQQIKQALSDKAPLIELGSGSGGHLVAHAVAHPDNYYVGFEIRYKRIFKTAQKAQRKQLSNLFLVRTDIEYLESFFSPNTVKKIYINFPDPWERRRWKKHRLTAPEYLDRYSRLLTSGGIVSFKTDHQGLFDDTLKILNERNDYTVTFLSRDLHTSERASTNILTEFEQLFKSKGMPIFAVEFVKN